MAMAPERAGIGIRRHFTTEGVHPYDEIEWDIRDARITNFRDGTVAFEQPDVEVPRSWSLNATNILAQKYFRGTPGTPEREHSLRQVADRVVDTITAWGIKDGYFVEASEAEAFNAELKHLIVTQKAAFNSPVWFNIGVKGVPQQASACQPYDALVSTPDGLRPIGELVETNAVGEKVFDANGLTRIVAVKANGTKRVLRVHTKAGYTLDVTPDHLVWRASDEQYGRFVEAGELRTGDSLEWHDVSVADARESSIIEIASIEDLGEMPVYDIQTESGEYLSGGLRVHNCFILAVDDTMDSILNWYVEEGIIFKGGSGSGINLSRIRSSQEELNGGGTASGPVSFMRGADASAGTIKCLHADTPIVTDRGLVAIRDAGPGSSVLTRHGFRLIEAVHDNGIRPLVRVRTSLGDEVVCTPEHRFWVRGSDGEEWREAGALRPDDSVAIDLESSRHGFLPRLQMPGHGHHNERQYRLPEQLDEGFAAWLGWIFGDGSITTVGSANFVAVEIGDDDPELVGRYEQLTRALFGEELTIYSTRHRDRPIGSQSIRFSSTQVIRFLELNGLRKGSAAELRVPGLVQTAPASIRAAFLAGLFEADGTTVNGYPTFCSVSEWLARDVHRLLLSIGIPSMVSRVDNRSGARGTRPLHTVRVVGGEGVRRFAKLVGFLSERKHAALAAAMLRKDASPYETQWHLPHVADELRSVWQATTSQRLRRALSPYCRSAVPRRMSLLRARDLLERFPDELSRTSLSRFADGTVFYSTVTVVPAEAGPTFDLTVADVHEYLVNNIVTHNSGGKTRRAAKMVILNADHPDVEDFIWCKAIEERKARALRDAGFDMDLDGKDSHSTQYQNANNSVRVTDEFMQAVLDDDDWDLNAATTGEAVRTIKARELFRQIAKAAWECADPGMQFDTTINRWHTAKNTGRINGSNPCSEYMHLDNSACNLASINLLRFYEDESGFDVDGFKAAVEVVFSAQEILVGNADYPTEKIAQTSRRFRQLGIGYANLGALLMAMGMPYDSDEGRAWAGAITALMTGHAYETSSRTAARMGPFAGYSENREHMLNVLRMHRDEVAKIDEELVQTSLLDAAQEAWDSAVELGEQYGVRNSQASVIAPTGCLVGGSFIPTERGLIRLRSLGDPSGEQWQELGITVQTDEGPRAATKFFVNGLEPVVDVTTHRGYRIQGTPRHRVKVVDEATGERQWRHFADVRAGDLVPLALDQVVGEPQTVVLPPISEKMAWAGEHHVVVPNEMTPELAEFVGYFMGDGSLHSRGLRMTVTKSDTDVVECLSRLGKSLFGIEARSAESGGDIDVCFHSVRLVEWWEACGFAKFRPHEGHRGKGYIAHIPDAVLHSNDPEVYRAFLRGLYEADGCVLQGYPSWTTASMSFSHDVQYLLLALGFVTTRKFDVSGRGSRLAGLRLLNKQANDRWLSEIGFISSRKNHAVDVGDHPQTARYDHIPVTQQMIDRIAPENGRLRRVAMMAYRRGRSVSRRLAGELLAHKDDAELRHALRFFYDRVVSAELGEEQLTYDLSVPDNVTYIANGFVSHNTIGLLMDCDTTGLEPDLGLVKMKKLVGGGTMSIVNQTVPRALRHLGYDEAQIADIVAYIDEHKSILGAPHLSADHVPVFACSMGDNTIHYMGHIRMMAAIQPAISGALSKTVNLPEEATVEDVEQLHIDAWRMGLKAVAIYRDNCKVAQPLATVKKLAAASGPEAHDAELAQKVADLEDALSKQTTVVVKQPIRERLPRRRRSSTYHFRVADCEGYAHVGEYDDGRAGELFIKASKQGSTLAGILDAFSISISLGLQHGVPLRTFVQKYTNMRFEPAGITDDPELRIATSLLDYIFRRIAVDYLPYEERAELGILTTDERTQPTLPGVDEEITASMPLMDEPIVDVRTTHEEPPPAPTTPAATQPDAPLCMQCGVQMIRSGSCHACPSCGSTSGCS